MGILRLALIIWCGLGLSKSWAEDLGPNLPESGQSLFDEIFYRVDIDRKAQYDVPFPLEKLLKRVRAFDPRVSHAMFPFSRSIQRPVDLSYDPTLNPRIVLHFRESNNLDLNDKLYFGYVKARDQLEVISYNKSAGRFEFQIVKDYSTDPKVYYVNRAICMSCHQAQAPIFSVAPWSDSSFGSTMSSLLLEKQHIRSFSPESDKKILRQLFGSIESENRADEIDRGVRQANNLMLAQRIWREGCGDSRECRLGLLLDYLDNVSPDEQTKKLFALAKVHIEASGLFELTFYDSRLTSTDLGIAEDLEKLGEGRHLNPFEKARLALDNLNVLGGWIERLRDLGMKDHPATRRDRYKIGNVVILHFALGGMIPWKERKLLQSAAGVQKLRNALQSLNAKGSHLFDSASLQIHQLMFEILTELGSSLAEKYREVESPHPTKVLFEGFIDRHFADPGLNAMSRNCALCHSGNLEFPPQFLAGAEEAVLEKVRQLRPRLIYKLENNLMPPTEELRRKLHDSGDYQVILGFLQGLE